MRDLGDARRAIGYYEQALAIHQRDRRPPRRGHRPGQPGERLRCNWGTPGGPSATTSRRWRSTGRSATATARAPPWATWGTPIAQLGDVRRAIGYYEQALAIHREIGDRRGEGNDLGNLGGAYLQLGDARRAIGYYEQALAIRREIGDRRGEGNDLGNLGNAYRQLGTPGGPSATTSRRWRSPGDRRPPRRGQRPGQPGERLRQLGDARRAIGYYEQALAIRREIGDRRGEGTDLGNLGNAYLQLGDARRAIGYYRAGAGDPIERSVT